MSDFFKSPPVLVDGGKERIWIDLGLFTYVPYHILDVHGKASSIVVIDDENVHSILGCDFLKDLTYVFGLKSCEKKSTILHYTIPPGEKSKSRAIKASIEDYMLENGCRRDTLIVALGGGVVGDISGYVAATYMRGVPFVQIPTTLLAMVDSSIGGKTGINTSYGKNLIGAFHHPSDIYIDPFILKSLCPRQMRNGMAEIIKTGLVCNPGLIELLENGENYNVLMGDSDAYREHSGRDMLLLQIVRMAASAKANVVSKDATDVGVRSILNYGHTIGHSIETLSSLQSIKEHGYCESISRLRKDLLHGECVSIGCCYEALLSLYQGNLQSYLTVSRILRLFDMYNLPTHLKQVVSSIESPERGRYCDEASPGVARWENTLRSSDFLSYERIVNAVVRQTFFDKKSNRSQIKYVSICDMGDAIPRPVNVQEALVSHVLSNEYNLEYGKGCFPLSDCQLVVPGSKSVSNRALVLASLGKGFCELDGFLFCEDTYVMIDSLRKLGICIEVTGSKVLVRGSEGLTKLEHSESNLDLWVGNSGTTCRFLACLCCLRRSGKVTLQGVKRMTERPIKDLVDALNDAGAKIEYNCENSSLPITIHGTGGWNNDHISVNSSMSSQFVSSLLMSCVYGTSGSCILKLYGDIVSYPYIEMTVKMMKQFGVHVCANNMDLNSTSGICDEFFISKGVYKNPCTYVIEADATAASYPLAIAALTGCEITISNMLCKVGESNPIEECLQGDNMFYQILEEMGCIVSHSEKGTTLIGPPCDCFMTLAVLLTQLSYKNKENNSSEDHTYRIINITNQRVKECDRIAATAKNLNQLGYCVRELKDGLEIDCRIKPDVFSKRKVYINCYSDHRIAMSMAVLGFVDPRVVITDKQCTVKTWPSFWYQLDRDLHLLENEVSCSSSGRSKQSCRSVDTGFRPHVILVGMRGSGKTTLGRKVAGILGMNFLDLDNVFCERHNVNSITNYVNLHGIESFRKLEEAILEDVLTYLRTSKATVISTVRKGCMLKCYFEKGCCQNCVDDEMIERRATLGNGFVIHLRRDVEKVLKKLSEKDIYPRISTGESIIDMFQRRDSFYQAVSSYDFVLHKDYENIEQDSVLLAKLVNRLSGFNINSSWPYFLCLTSPDVRQISNLFTNCSTTHVEEPEDCSNEWSAVELRVDMLKSPLTISYVREQLACVRRIIPINMKIIFTVRTRQHGGMFNLCMGAKKANRGDSCDNNEGTFDCKQELLLKDLLYLACRDGCSFIDIESTFNIKLAKMVRSYLNTSKIIGSVHDISYTGVYSEERVKTILKEASLETLSDVVKVVLAPGFFSSNIVLHKVISQYKIKPVIALVAGPEGIFSRILNTFFTPVTHKEIIHPAAPNQLTREEIEEAKELLEKLIFHSAK